MSHPVTCFICGREPNPWCSEYHLPDARMRVEQMRSDADRAEQAIAAYEAAAKEGK